MSILSIFIEIFTILDDFDEFLTVLDHFKTKTNIS